MAGIFPITLTWTGNTADPSYTRSGEATKPEGQAS